MRRLAVALLVGAAVLVFLRLGWAPPVALALAACAASILDPPVLRLVGRLAVLLALAFAAATTGAAVAWSSGLARGLEVGGSLLLRLLVLAVVAALVTRSVDAEAILRLTRRLRLERLGLVLGLALNVLPHLAVAARDVWAAQVVRGRRRGRFAQLAALPRLVEVMLAHTARIAEEAAAAAALRGHSTLVQARLPMEDLPPRVVVITGGTGCGKTAVLEGVVAALRDSGEGLAGFLQPGIWQHDDKVGFRVVDVTSGEEAALARRVARGHGQYGTRFHFADEGFAVARRALERCRPGDVLVVDELGPLELRGRGHMQAVRRALAVPGLAAAAIVVRRNLVPTLLAALAAVDAVVVDVEDHDDPQAAILAALSTGDGEVPEGSAGRPGRG